MSREAIHKVWVRDVHSVSVTCIAEISDYFFHVSQIVGAYDAFVQGLCQAGGRKFSYLKKKARCSAIKS